MCERGGEVATTSLSILCLMDEVQLLWDAEAGDARVRQTFMREQEGTSAVMRERKAGIKHET